VGPCRQARSCVTGLRPSPGQAWRSSRVRFRRCRKKQERARQSRNACLDLFRGQTSQNGRIEGPPSSLAGRAGASRQIASQFARRAAQHVRNGWRGGSAEPSRHPCRTFLHRLPVDRRSVVPDGGLCGPGCVPVLCLRRTLRTWLALQPVGCHRPCGCDPPGEPVDLGHLARLSALNYPAFPATCTLICIRAIFHRSSRPVRPATRFQFPPHRLDRAR
jgi:hypothetical protein